MKAITFLKTIEKSTNIWIAPKCCRNLGAPILFSLTLHIPYTTSHTFKGVFVVQAEIMNTGIIYILELYLWIIWSLQKIIYTRGTLEIIRIS